MTFDVRRKVREESGFIGVRRPDLALDHLHPACAADGAAPTHVGVRYTLANKRIAQAILRRSAQRSSFAGGKLHEEATNRARHDLSLNQRAS